MGEESGETRTVLRDHQPYFTEKEFDIVVPRHIRGDLQRHNIDVEWARERTEKALRDVCHLFNIREEDIHFDKLVLNRHKQTISDKVLGFGQNEPTADATMEFSPEDRLVIADIERLFKQTGDTERAHIEEDPTSIFKYNFELAIYHELGHAAAKVYIDKFMKEGMRGPTVGLKVSSELPALAAEYLFSSQHTEIDFTDPEVVHSHAVDLQFDIRAGITSGSSAVYDYSMPIFADWLLSYGGPDRISKLYGFPIIDDAFPSLYNGSDIKDLYEQYVSQYKLDSSEVANITWLVDQMMVWTPAKDKFLGGTFGGSLRAVKMNEIPVEWPENVRKACAESPHTYGCFFRNNADEKDVLNLILIQPENRSVLLVDDFKRADGTVILEYADMNELLVNQLL